MLPLSPFIFAGLLLAIVGWGGVAVLVFFTLPTLGPRWLFMLFLLQALSGTVMPLIALIHRRFAGKYGVEGTVIVRQAIWVGVYGDILVWLMMGRVMTTQMAVFLGLGFVLIEFFLRMRERSQFQPGVPENE